MSTYTEVERYKNGNIKSIKHYANNYNGEHRLRTEHLHSRSGPAYQSWHENGQEAKRNYMNHGQFHNLDGYAVQAWDDSGVEVLARYWVYGVCMSKADFMAYTAKFDSKAPCDGKVVEVDGQEYRLEAVNND